MNARPELHLVNTQTGEIIEDERDVLIDQLQAELKGKVLTIGKMKRELRQLRSVEPEAEVIRDILGYWRERCSPTAVIAPGGKRWEKTRARLHEKLDGRDPFTPHELKLAIDGALLDPWISGKARGSKGYLDPQTIFRDAEMVEKLRDLAIGFEAQAGAPVCDLIDVAHELRVVSWRQVLRVCECTHRRIEHVRGDPDHEGRERCLMCRCEDFFEEPFEWMDKRH